MLAHFNRWRPYPPLLRAWLLMAALMILQGIYIGVCHYFKADLPQLWATETLIVLRSSLYAAVIVLFPLTNLLRHLQLRLNQTMPSPKTAAERYSSTVMVSQGLIAMVGVCGLVLYFGGDTVNSLYIFSGLAYLGYGLHRPKWTEYQAIVEALNSDETIAK
jgi:hypothetical protein